MSPSTDPSTEPSTDPSADAPAEPGPQSRFATVLRRSIARSGLTIEETAARASHSGARVSAATLSYWTRGRSLPRRRSSLPVVIALESVLGLEDGTLADHVEIGADAWRYRSSNEVSAVVADNVEITSLREEWGLRWDDGLRRESVVSTLLLDPQEGPARIAYEAVVTATRDGADGVLLIFDAPHARIDALSPGRGARIARQCELPSGRIAFELLLERPLRAGEAAVVDVALPLRTAPEEIRSFSAWSIRPAGAIIAQVELPRGEGKVRVRKELTGLYRTGQAFALDAETVEESPRRLQGIIAEVTAGRCSLSWEPLAD
ncbi:hypothetical protein Bequi_00395 [Brachybacterium sp. JHP9]|uniref:HTH cro/C1-type domain-containing protein n=1 Tax=Brachybacterium equifaecis TaxID=2910770 RepID=A0ABT0QYT1_9MICO|nr:hypothetical protein [Brachybacterium equifaecis]MCL6421855.1 hypothetical protein [Brachybacterium equifaecis]